VCHAKAVIAFLDRVIETLSATGNTFPFIEVFFEDCKAI
jgi:hypothetical protein